MMHSEAVLIPLATLSVGTPLELYLQVFLNRTSVENFPHFFFFWYISTVRAHTVPHPYQGLCHTEFLLFCLAYGPDLTDIIILLCYILHRQLQVSLELDVFVTVFPGLSVPKGFCNLPVEYISIL